PTERLRVSLKSEKRPLLVFFKDLNPKHQMNKARAVRAFDLEPGRRELQMYDTIPPRSVRDAAPVRIPLGARARPLLGVLRGRRADGVAQLPRHAPLDGRRPLGRALPCGDARPARHTDTLSAPLRRGTLPAMRRARRTAPAPPRGAGARPRGARPR